MLAHLLTPVAFALMFFTGAITECRGQSSGFISREFDIKAVYLYHFSSYIEWPPSSLEKEDSHFVIGVFETNPFDGALERVAQKKQVRGRPIEIGLIRSTAEVLDCQILYIPKSVPIARQDEVLAATLNRPILTVGETNDFIARGGRVELFLENNKVRFAMGAESVRRSGLKINSKLLTIAKIVSDK